MLKDTVLTCEVCALAWYKGGVCRLHARHFQEKKGWEYAMGLRALRDRLSGNTEKGSSESSPVDEATSKKMPSLWEWLTAHRDETGEARETGTILIFCEEGLVKVCACNRDTGHVAFISAKTLQDAFLKLDKGLANDSLDWRLSKREKGAKGKSR